MISARVTLCRVPFLKCGPTERPSLLITTPMVLLKSICKYPSAWEFYLFFSRPRHIRGLERSWSPFIPILGLVLGNEFVDVSISRHESFKQVPLGGTNAIVRSRPFEVVLPVSFMSQMRKWLYAIVHRTWTCIKKRGFLNSPFCYFSFRLICCIVSKLLFWGVSLTQWVGLDR